MGWQQHAALVPSHALNAACGPCAGVNDLVICSKYGNGMKKPACVAAKLNVNAAAEVKPCIT